MAAKEAAADPTVAGPAAVRNAGLALHLLPRRRESYADQNERDYDAFAAAVKSGRLTARTRL